MELRDLTDKALEIHERIRAKTAQPLPDLMILRQDRVTAFEAVIYKPVVCLILQGAKITSVGDRVAMPSAGDALIVSHDLPVESRITEATSERPYVALIVSLDLGLLRGLYEQVGPHAFEARASRSLLSGPARPDLIDAVARYLALQEDPLHAAVLGPSLLREIHFRLLMSPVGGTLRSLLSVDSHASRVSQAILKLRAGFRETLKVGDLARVAGMSQSSFHSHFKQVTGTTPLQYQKDLRMIAARDLLRAGRHSVAAAGFDVGYESPTHFSRDYQRKFGIAPSRELASTPVPA